MPSPLVQVADLETGIRLVELNRPEKRNALCVDLLQEFADAIETCDPAKGQRVVIVRGAGPVFCAGLDLQEAQDRSKGERSAQLIARSLQALSSSRSIIIAAVHGGAIAGGAGIMSACDFVVAARGTSIGYPEVHRGLVAGLVMTFLRRQLRERDVRELLLLGEIINAERAAEMGLVNRVVGGEELMDSALDIARRVVKGAPEAVARTKQMIAELWHHTVAEDLHWAHEHHIRARGSVEAEEGMRAFFEKRSPQWIKPTR
jgi:methylglutaconyl-CoA hydratase